MKLRRSRLWVSRPSLRQRLRHGFLFRVEAFCAVCDIEESRTFWTPRAAQRYALAFDHPHGEHYERYGIPDSGVKVSWPA